MAEHYVITNYKRAKDLVLKHLKTVENDNELLLFSTNEATVKELKNTDRAIKLALKVLSRPSATFKVVYHKLQLIDIVNLKKK